jgi:hypothetical protein
MGSILRGKFLTPVVYICMGSVVRGESLTLAGIYPRRELPPHPQKNFK